MLVHVSCTSYPILLADCDDSKEVMLITDVYLSEVLNV